MKTPKYLLAKYIPDLDRFEPRNIGVVVWCPHGVEARFLAERAGAPGSIDGRSIPSFVTDPSAYRQWIQFWQAELQKPDIETPDGRQIARGVPEFLEALRAWNRGNFLLAEGGVLLDPLDDDDLTALVEYLFRVLVEAGRGDEPRDPSLDQLCDCVLEETQLANHPHFLNRYVLECPVAANATETFEFSHAYANGCFQRLYQRVPLSQRRRLLRKTVHDSAWMLEKVIQAKLIRPEQTAALVYVADDQQNDAAVMEAVQVLGSVTRVLNLQHYATVRDEFASLSALSPHESLATANALCQNGGSCQNGGPGLDI